ncbi:hypothetical protein J1P26_25050 [Neobacillus sp. MM2021_6]|nr:hypothetical protein [Neobacillus sp. MM2021_6]NHC19047.1 transposase [Bacillus sp. MM2020_4]
MGLFLSKKGHPLYLKMEVVSNLKGETLIDFADKSIQPGSTISSDAYHPIEHLKKLFLTTSIKYQVYNAKKV